MQQLSQSLFLFQSQLSFLAVSQRHVNKPTARLRQPLSASASASASTCSSRSWSCPPCLLCSGRCFGCRILSLARRTFFSSTYLWREGNLIKELPALSSVLSLSLSLCLLLPAYPASTWASLQAETLNSLVSRVPWASEPWNYISLPTMIYILVLPPSPLLGVCVSCLARFLHFVFFSQIQGNVKMLLKVHRNFFSCFSHVTCRLYWVRYLLIYFYIPYHLFVIVIELCLRSLSLLVWHTPNTFLGNLHYKFGNTNTILTLLLDPNPDARISNNYRGPRTRFTLIVYNIANSGTESIWHPKKREGRTIIGSLASGGSLGMRL